MAAEWSLGLYLKAGLGRFIFYISDQNRSAFSLAIENGQIIQRSSKGHLVALSEDDYVKLDYSLTRFIINFTALFAFTTSSWILGCFFLNTRKTSSTNA